MFPKLSSASTVGELLAITEIIEYFHKSEILYKSHLQTAAPARLSSLQEQERLVNDLGKQLEEHEQSAKSAGIYFLLEYKKWGNNFPLQ